MCVFHTFSFCIFSLTILLSYLYTVLRNKLKKKKCKHYFPTYFEIFNLRIQVFIKNYSYTNT